MSATLSVSRETARRFQRRALGLDRPHASVDAALEHHGYVQIDPINVCGRMHDLILRNRVEAYREGDLFRHLHGGEGPLPPETRTAFEHHLPSTHILVALTLDAWPHLRAAMRIRSRRAGPWSGRLTPKEKALLPRILAEIEARGPLGSEDIDLPGRATRFWGSATLVKSAMQKLFFHGELLIAQRDKGRRRYDLPHRVLPAPMLTAGEPSKQETFRWETLLKLRQRRLVSLKRTELPFVEDRVAALRLEDGSTVHALREDLPLLEEVRLESAPEPGHLLLLAPLDPLIYDRALTRRLWDFDYTWEVYTPPARRKRGYYALPALAHDRLVGHVDPKAERETGRLRILGRQLARGHSLTPAVRHLATFLSLKPCLRRML